MSFNILIVDDEPDFADFIAEAVGELGHEATIASNDDEFCSAYTAGTEIIFLDLFMPGMDGIEILRFLSENGSKASVVLMSGRNTAVLNSARELAEERKIEVLAVLQKPIMFSSVADALAKYGGKKSRPALLPTELASAEDIRRGLEQEEFFLVYQPQIRLGDRKAVGAEALIRWDHPERGLLPPSSFLPVVEGSDLIGPVTDQVIKCVCRDISELGLTSGLRWVSINLSPNSIFDVEFPEKLERYFNHHDIDPSHIVLEITETAVMSDIAVSLDILTRLRMKGFELSIDDFGTGYSSMEQLVRIPFSELKIDQKFVRNLNANAEYRTVVEIATMLGHNLGMTVIAEGVEDEETLAAVREIGCDEGQGYGIARPMPLSDLKPWLANWPIAANAK